VGSRRHRARARRSSPPLRCLSRAPLMHARRGTLVIFVFQGARAFHKPDGRKEDGEELVAV
jgi:hypothetical protein